jgi:REP element-mobilizing transposase RayT
VNILFEALSGISPFIYDRKRSCQSKNYVFQSRQRFTVNTNKSSSVETEEIKQDTVEAPHASSMVWMPTVAPDMNRDEQQKAAPEPPNTMAPQAATPPLSSELSFSCVLIPRFSDHYLAGDIVDWLAKWMKQVCISYGWRLEALAIRPGYMQWVMHVPMNSNPAQFMRLIRRYTSEQIFEDFPRFKQKNVSGEFWAPGNLVLPGNQLQSPDQVNEFILQTRKYQGFQ